MKPMTSTFDDTYRSLEKIASSTLGLALPGQTCPEIDSAIKIVEEAEQAAKR